jgi:pimeloyl-ACP methyl ester carboxylesterase
MAEDHRRDRVFGSHEEAIDARLDRSLTTPRRFVEEEAREHLVEGPPGTFRWRYCQSAVVFAYGELCLPAPPPETLRAPTLLVHAGQFGLVRDDQLETYRDRVETVAVPGGHMVIWDAYEETADAVARFLEDPRA